MISIIVVGSILGVAASAVITIASVKLCVFIEKKVTGV